MEKIPREYVQIITDLFDKLEEVNGEKYQICIFSAGKEKEIVIKSFEERKDYLIEMSEGFTELNGSYPTFDELKRKLVLLDYPGSKLAEKIEETLWKCSFCEKDEGNKIEGVGETCRSCQKVHLSKWGNLRISLEEGKIFDVQGAKVEMVGTITFH